RVNRAGHRAQERAPGLCASARHARLGDCGADLVGAPQAGSGAGLAIAEIAPEALIVLGAGGLRQAGQRGQAGHEEAELPRRAPDAAATGAPAGAPGVLTAAPGAAAARFAAGRG